MHVVESKMDILDEELNLFDEDDWDFLNVSSESRNFQFFEDIPDKEFQYNDNKKGKFAIFVILSSILGVGVAILFITCYQIVLIPHLSTDEQVANAVNEIEAKGMEYIDGESIASDEFLKISTVFNDYFSVLKSESDYQDLNDLCTVESNFAKMEKKYRTDASASYDTEDCYARALREFGRYISLANIEEIRYKDGIYYCYVNLSVPDTDDFYEYFYRYKYEMTKHFGVYDLDYINVTRYLLSVTDNNDIPLHTQEFLFKVSYVDNEYLITDDSQVTSICNDAYNVSISNITSILGGTLVKTQYE